MAKGTTVQSGIADVKGLRRFQRTLREAGDDLSDFKEANTRAAKIVEPVARSKAPARSGRLAASVRSSGTKQAGVIRAGSARVPYAGVIHFGTERAKNPFWVKRRITGRPFAAAAAKETEPTWARVYQDAVDKAIKRIQGA